MEAGQLPTTGGVRPQLSVIVDLKTVTGDAGGLGGDIGWAGPLEPQACRRLACDATVTRVVVSRQPPEASAGCQDHGPRDPATSAPGRQGWLPAVLATLPPVLGGAPSRPLDLGRATRVVTPAQRQALAVRDGGCVFPGCGRPLAWCEAHHIWHWLEGGPTDLDNLALVCRAIIGPSMTAAGGSSAAPTDSSPPPHHIEDTRPPEPPMADGRLPTARDR